MQPHQLAAADTQVDHFDDEREHHREVDVPLADVLAQAVGGLLWLAVVFFIIAIVAYVLGAQGVAGMSAGIGRTLLFVFLVLAVIFLIVNFLG